MKKFIILYLILLFIPLTIKAEELTVTLQCPPKVAPKQEISCSIITNSDIPLSGIKGKILLDNNLTYKNLISQNNWSSKYNKKEGFVITKIQNNGKENEIAKLNIFTPELSNNNNYKIYLTDIEASDINHKLLNHNNIDTTIQLLSDDNTLSSLTINNATLQRKFDKNITNYEAIATKDNITISATPTDTNAKVSGDIGNKKLNYGSNVFNIIVTSELGTSKTYTIIVTRKTPSTTTNNSKTQIANNDISLKDITIKGYKIDFESGKYNYELTVPNSQETIDIIITPNNDKATVTINKPDKLEIGNNIITIIITAENGEICKYTVNVNRKDLSHDNSIKKIIIDNYKLNIKKNIYDYNLKIHNENKLKINVILNNNLATYKITGNKNLKDGSIITITVTSEAKDIQNYKIKISKQIINSNKNIFKNNSLTIIIAILLIITTSITLIRKRVFK